MSKLNWLVGFGVAGVMVFAATSRGDDAPAQEPSQPPPSVDLSLPPPNPLPEQRPRSPHDPYDIGPPEAVWRYEQLSAKDQEVLDRGRDTSAWEPVLDVYAQAAAEQAEQAQARMAAAFLGIDGLNELGVVP